MASRLILTLLALFAGLAAQTGPAQAQRRGAESAQLVAPCLAAGAHAAVAGQGWIVRAAAMPARRAQASPGGVEAGFSAAARRHSPCVRIGIDRARE